MGGSEASYNCARDRRCVGHTDGTVTKFFWGYQNTGISTDSSLHHFRNRSGAESAYWKNTNVVRRNLLMAAVRRSIWMEWDPMGEAYVDNQSLAELRALAFRRLTETVVSSVSKTKSEIVLSTDSTFSGQPYKNQPDAFTFASTFSLTTATP